jgi:hypothetical protein
MGNPSPVRINKQDGYPVSCPITSSSPIATCRLSRMMWRRAKAACFQEISIKDQMAVSGPWLRWNPKTRKKTNH